MLKINTNCPHCNKEIPVEIDIYVDKINGNICFDLHVDPKFVEENEEEGSEFVCTECNKEFDINTTTLCNPGKTILNNIQLTKNHSK